MLTEINNARQIPSEGHRRWFRDDEMDLIVWYGSGESEGITGFQLCYDKLTSERALTWREPDRYEHNAIDDGSGGRPGRAGHHSQMTPILVADGLFDTSRIAKVFRERSAKLPKDVAGLVAGKILTYPG